MITAIKNKKITQIPTELNYINYTNARLKSHNQRINYNQRLIIILLLWCIGLTTFIVIQQIQEHSKKLNNEILIQELVPIDDFEVIND